MAMVEDRRMKGRVIKWREETGGIAVYVKGSNTEERADQ